MMTTCRVVPWDRGTDVPHAVRYLDVSVPLVRGLAPLRQPIEFSALGIDGS